LSALSDPQRFYSSPDDEHSGLKAQALSNEEASDLSFLFQHWAGCQVEGQLIIRPNSFWTSANSFWALPQERRLYEDLKESELVVFKGDLNYRKLTADVRHPSAFLITRASTHPSALLVLLGHTSHYQHYCSHLVPCHPTIFWLPHPAVNTFLRHHTHHHRHLIFSNLRTSLSLLLIIALLLKHVADSHAGNVEYNRTIHQSHWAHGARFRHTDTGFAHLQS